MTTTATTEPNTQGADAKDLNPGETGKGPAAPKDVGTTKPADAALEKSDDEEHGQPVKKDAPAAEPEKKDEPDAEEWDGEYIEIADEVGQSVINMLNEKGVGAREANLIFQEAISSGDLSKVKWDVLTEKLGPDQAKLARIGIEDYYNRVYSKNVATTTAIHEQFGGKDNWAKVAKWVKNTEAANPTRKAEFDEIRRGIDAGGKLATYAAAELKKLYEGAPGNNGLGTKKIVNGDTNVTVEGGPLSRAEYTKLRHEVNDRKHTKAEIDALWTRRQAGMKAGI